MTIKTIYLADSENIFIDCLATTLKLEQEFEIVGRNSNGAIAYNEIRSLTPDLLITD
ncbi:MAG: response regulator transcription factor, partial [Gammaproteobacteria bacterium]|nr:response regulator transcription factor [Gammaproteobacteria bacterium]